MDKVVKVNKITVREFANLLLSLPEEVQSRTFTCSGYPEFFLHDREQEGFVTVDEEEFID